MNAGFHEADVVCFRLLNAYLPTPAIQRQTYQQLRSLQVSVPSSALLIGSLQTLCSSSATHIERRWAAGVEMRLAGPLSIADLHPKEQAHMKPIQNTASDTQVDRHCTVPHPSVVCKIAPSSPIALSHFPPPTLSTKRSATLQKAKEIAKMTRVGFEPTHISVVEI